MATRFISNEGLLTLLQQADDEELLALTRALNPSATHPMSPNTLVSEISLAGGHGVANFFRGSGTGYIDIVSDVIEALEVIGVPHYYDVFSDGIRVRELDQFSRLNASPEELKRRASNGLRTAPFTDADVPTLIRLGSEYCAAAEQKILLKVLQATYEKLGPEDRAKFDAEVARIAASYGQGDNTGKLAGAAGLMVIGNLGGFATYMLMSSVLSTISFGMLGFGAYTAASSALSVLLGPVGWLALGGTAAYTLGKPELKKTVPFVATVGLLRQRVKSGAVVTRKTAVILRSAQSSSQPPASSDTTSASHRSELPQPKVIESPAIPAPVVDLEATQMPEAPTTKALTADEIFSEAETKRLVVEIKSFVDLLKSQSQQLPFRDELEAWADKRYRFEYQRPTGLKLLVSHLPTRPVVESVVAKEPIDTTPTLSIEDLCAFLDNLPTRQMEQDIEQYLRKQKRNGYRLPDGHLFQSFATDKFGQVDSWPKPYFCACWLLKHKL